MTAPPDPFIGVVTARDVYDATRETQSDIRAALARVTVLEERQGDQESRLRALERWRWGTGAALALALLSIASGDATLANLIP